MHLKTGLKVLFGKVKGRWLVRSITQIRLHVGTLLICHFLALHAITSSLVPILDLCAGTASKWCMADSISFVPGASEVDGHKTAFQFKLHLAVGNVICIHHTEDANSAEICCTSWK